MERKFALICAWLTAGRPSELANISYGRMHWDSLFKTVVATVLQFKTAKPKIISFPAGSDRHCDFYLALADIFCLPPDVNQAHKAMWLNPILKGVKSPGTKLGDFIRSLTEGGRGSRGKYRSFKVPNLPQGASAGGFRPGVINFLMMFMARDFVVRCTGHDLKGASALYEYLEAILAMLMPGAVVLAGWPAFPYGKMGMGPRPASLAALHLSADHTLKLHELIHELYHHNSDTPKQLIRGGALYPMVEAAFASQVSAVVTRDPRVGSLLGR